MKAVYIEQFGGPEVVKYGDLPDPTAAAGQVVVDAFAASVNGADWKVRAGHYGKPAFPLVLGRDFSGVVGVASFAIQLAKHLGARVITTASAANLSYLRGIGADQVIDYNATDFTKVVSNCDAVFDTVGGDVATRSFAVLKPGGRAAFIASGAKAPVPERSDVTALRPAVGRDRPHLDRVAALYRLGAVRSPHVTLYDLPRAREALAV